MKLFRLFFTFSLVCTLGLATTPIAYAMEASEVDVDVMPGTDPLAEKPTETRQLLTNLHLWEAVQDWEPGKDEASVSALRAALADGANLDEPNSYGLTILYYAAFRGSTTLVQALLTHIKATYSAEKAQALINAKNRNGLTALHIAARKGSVEIVDALLAAGADATIQDKAGNTPLLWAISHDHDDVASLLRKEAVRKDADCTPTITPPTKQGWIRQFKQFFGHWLAQMGLALAQ